MATCFTEGCEREAEYRPVLWLGVQPNHMQSAGIGVQALLFVTFCVKCKERTLVRDLVVDQTQKDMEVVFHALHPNCGACKIDWGNAFLDWEET